MYLSHTDRVLWPFHHNLLGQEAMIHQRSANSKILRLQDLKDPNTKRFRQTVSSTSGRNWDLISDIVLRNKASQYDTTPFISFCKALDSNSSMTVNNYSTACTNWISPVSCVFTVTSFFSLISWEICNLPSPCRITCMEAPSIPVGYATSKPWTCIIQWYARVEIPNIWYRVKGILWSIVAEANIASTYNSSSPTYGFLSGCDTLLQQGYARLSFKYRYKSLPLLFEWARICQKCPETCLSAIFPAMTLKRTAPVLHNQTCDALETSLFWGAPIRSFYIPCFHAGSATMFDLLLICSNIICWPWKKIHYSNIIPDFGWVDPNPTVGTKVHAKGILATSGFWSCKVTAYNTSLQSCLDGYWTRDLRSYSSWQNNWIFPNIDKYEMFLKLNYCWCFRNLGACTSWGRCNLVSFNLGGSEKFLPWRLPVES